MLNSFALVIWLVTGVILIITVLLHSPKGDGMGGMAVGAAAGMFSSTRSAESTLNRATWTLVTIFLLLAVLLSAGWLQRDIQQGGFSPVVAPATSSETDPVDSETDPVDSEADPVDSEADPVDSEGDPVDSEADPVDRGVSSPVTSQSRFLTPPPPLDPEEAPAP